MGQSLRVDTDLLQALTPELAAIADAAQQELARLKDRLAAEGECWGNDEAGRVFGESYEPAAKEGITGFENLVHNLHGMSDGVAGIDNTFHNQDRDIGSQLRKQQSDFDSGNSIPISPSFGQPGWSPGPPQTATPIRFEPSPTSYDPPPAQAGTPESPVPVNPPAYQPDGYPVAPVQPNATDYGPSATPTPLEQEPVPGTSAAPTTQAPAAPAARTPAQPVAQTPAPPSATTPPAANATPKPGGTDPAAARRPPDARSARPPIDSPWLRNAPGTPWSRNAPSSPPPGQVFPPRRNGPEPGAAKSAKPGRDAERQRKRVSVQPERPRVRTDPAAVAAAQALAARHGLRIIGFETSGVEKRTVDEIAAAVDDILGRYPFLDLAGIEITDLRDGTVSRVVWDRPADEEHEPVPGGWILLDRVVAAIPAVLGEKLAAAARSGDRVAGSGERPMYSTIVRDLGRILEAAAGPLVRQLAQRSLITEYRRISGPWDRGDTLASIVRGYREWRAQLSRACFSGDRFDSGAAVIEAFTEVELRGDSACGPAKVLHRLAIEHVRGQSSA